MFRLTAVGAAALLALGGTLVAPPAQAQGANDQRIEITGSKIRRVSGETLQPVITITREDIERSGKTTVTEILASTPVISGGSFAETTLGGNSFAPGTASVSLRGLGVNTTLVLLNGRRVANYGFAQNINESFVDLNSIPVSAIQRIEILKDGASAIYGSDAIAGVINVILRKDFKGGEFATSFGSSIRNDAQEIRASLTLGAGDLGTNRFNAFGIIDYYQRNEIGGESRDFSRNVDNRGQGPGGLDQRSPTGNPGYFFGGTGNVPTPFSNCPASQVVSGASLGVGSGNVCAYDFAGANKLVPPSQRVGFLGAATFNLSPAAQLFGEFMFNRNETDRFAAATPAAFGLATAHPDRPGAGTATPSTFTSVAYRFLEAGDRLNDTSTESMRTLLGIRGNVGGFDYEAGALLAKSETVDQGRNYIIQERATEAFAGTLAGFAGQFYRVINPSLNPAGMLDAIKIDPRRTGESELKQFDARVSGELFSLPGGMAGIAVGVEHREESVKDLADPRVALTTPAATRVTVAGSGGTSVVGDRTLTSGFLELSLPLMKGVETQLAVRTDDYSDFGRTTNPKFGVSLRPARNVLIRAGYAEGFRAPSLAELNLGESTSFPQVTDTARCTAYRAGLPAGDARIAAACGSATGTGVNAQVRSIFLGNKDLNPETSKSWSLGLVLEPFTDFSVAIDAYLIEHENRILAPTATFILNNAALFPGAVVRNPQSADDIAANAPGTLRGVSGDLTAGIVRTFFNASKQETSGVDLEFRYRLGLGAAGRLDLNTAWTYIGKLKRQINPGQALVEIADTYQYPRWRNTSGVTWAVGPFTTALSSNTIGSYEDLRVVSPGVLPRVKKMTTFDLNVSYTGFKNVTLSLGGNNIFDKQPPFSNEGWYGYDSSTHNPRGAFWYGRARLRF
ncbi:MAG: TonB-dependent receptor [Rubrivivax sp.]|jgi:iron complex outermembrane receptor protein|nr:TonB-dependent receptor [Rubrivivax sp.]